MNRPIPYGEFKIIVGISGVGYHSIGNGIHVGSFVTAIEAPSNANYGYAVQSKSGRNIFILPGLTGDVCFSDLYAITSGGKLIIAGTQGTYTVEIFIYDDEKLG